MEQSEDPMEKRLKSLEALTRQVVETNRELSSYRREDRRMIKEIKEMNRGVKEDSRRLMALWIEHEEWLRNHEVRLQSHYKSFSNLKDNLR